MADPIRIANCSGFFGDRLSAAREMVEGGPIDVLTGDWLAELTMLILARTRVKRPNGGYARTFVTQMEQVMGTCLDRGIKVVSNAGGLDPDGCAEAVAEVAEKLGLHPKIAYVRGDDLMPRIDELIAARPAAPLRDRRADQGRLRLPHRQRLPRLLGHRRCPDARRRHRDHRPRHRRRRRLRPGRLASRLARTDWDALAGAVAAGHVIECGTQATGGNYSFFTEVPGMSRVGFPWAEIAADGSSVIGKHDGTGGEVSVGTVTSQLLYEIGGPEYFGPGRDHALRHDRARAGRPRTGCGCTASRASRRRRRSRSA